MPLLLKRAFGPKNIQYKVSGNNDSVISCHKKEWRVDWDRLIVEKQFNLLPLMLGWIKTRYDTCSIIFSKYLWTVEKSILAFDLLKTKQTKIKPFWHENFHQSTHHTVPIILSTGRPSDLLFIDITTDRTGVIDEIRYSGSESRLFAAFCSILSTNYSSIFTRSSGSIVRWLISRSHDCYSPDKW